MKQQGASFAHSCFSISTHDGANLCGAGRQRGGRGREGQDCGCHTAANNPRVTSSVGIRHGSHNIEAPPPQMRLVPDLYSFLHDGEQT